MMVWIKVLGSGCPNCTRLAELAEKALASVREDLPEVEGAVEKVTDMDRFLDYGLLHTPGLVINEKLVSAGKIPSVPTIAGWIREAVSAGQH